MDGWMDGFVDCTRIAFGLFCKICLEDRNPQLLAHNYDEEEEDAREV